MANEVQRLNDIYRAQIAEAQSAGQELASREKKDDAFGAPKKKMVVTNADKKGNTPAYQNYKKGDKRYVAADHLKEDELQEKQKDTPDQVKAVIAYDKARKATDDAVYDTEHGEDEKAKQERDYAAWERSKMKKDDPNWEHKKGSTSESVSKSVGNLSQIYIEGVLKKEVKDLKKGAETLKQKNIDKADAIADEYVPSEFIQKLVESGKFSEEEIGRMIEVDRLGTVSYTHLTLPTSDLV